MFWKWDKSEREESELLKLISNLILIPFFLQIHGLRSSEPPNGIYGHHSKN